MNNNCNWKNTYIDNLDYIPSEKQNKFYKNAYKSNTTTKANNFYSKNYQKYRNYQKENFINNFQFSPNSLESEHYKSFYPKNYMKSKKYYSNGYNNDEYYNYPSNKNNDFFNYENSINNNYNNEINEVQKEEKKLSFDSEISTNNSENLLNDEKTENNYEKEKPKKFGIKSIPHPQRKKNHGSCYISGKKLLPYQQKKEDKNFFKKERKLSISSNQNNFDSAKHSISTLNTSSSSYKEKEKNVFNEEKNITNKNENQIDELIIKDDNIMKNDNNNNVQKNKFDNNIEVEKFQPINPYLENTEILKVNVKTSKNETVIFKLRRFDDLFLTIKLFCEINSIDEKFIKPFIIKSLCTLNTIYQLYNSQISNEDIFVLKKIKKINDIEK